MTETMASSELLSKLSLRALDLSDIDGVMEWVTDDRVSQYCRWETYTSKEDAINYIKNIAIPHPWFKAICLDNKAIGAISVTPYSGEDRCRGELGYVLASGYWGKGIATRAVKMVVDCVFSDWPHLERLEALVDLNNRGSQKVLEKAGFQNEGVLRKYCVRKGVTVDMVMYSFLSTDPKITKLLLQVATRTMTMPVHFFAEEGGNGDTEMQNFGQDGTNGAGHMTLILVTPANPEPQDPNVKASQSNNEYHSM